MGRLHSIVTGGWARAFSTGLVLALLCLAPTPVAAQAAPPPDAAIAELEALAATIEDEAKRAELLDNIRALIAANQGEVTESTAVTRDFGTRIVHALAESARLTGSQLVDLANAVGDLPDAVQAIRAEAADPEARARWTELLVKLVVVLGVGWVVEFLVRMALRRPRRSLESRDVESLWVRSVFLAARTVLDVIPAATFATAAYGALSIIQPAEQARLVMGVFITAYLIAFGIGAAARVVLVPAAPSLRLLPLADETANYLFIWVRRMVAVAVFGYFAAEAARILGLPPGGALGLLRVLGLLLTVMAVVFVLQNRVGGAGWIAGPADSGAGLLRRRFADIWHVLAILYIVSVFVVWLLDVEGGFAYLARATAISALILVVAFVVTGGVRHLVERGFHISDQLTARYPFLEKRANRYLPVLQVVLRVVIWATAALALVGAWGGDVIGWLTGDAGTRFIGGVVSIAIVVTGAVLVWEGASTAIERYLEQTDPDGNLVERSARARTLLPLLRNALFVVLTVMVVLIVLSEVGINIAPLLAGAGVVGLAIGFGSQKLVQDVITGAFILFEDAIAVGDVVNVAGIGGLVEAISIRSIRLRDLSGNVHTIPFSSVDTVTNMTKEYSYYLLDIGVAYREDTDEVAEVAKTIVEELREDPEFGPEILEPLEVLGVDQFGDSAVIVKARIKTLPIKQWMVGREFNRRMKKRFDELGIEIPFPHRTLYFGELKDGSSPAGRIRIDSGTETKPAASPPEKPSTSRSETAKVDLPDAEG